MELINFFMKDKHITVLGLGKSGIGAAKLAEFLGYTVTILDEKKSIETQLSKNIYIETSNLKQIPSASEFIVISPGIPPESKLAKLAQLSDIPIISELEFAAKHCPYPIIAITGTNGKTTTTELTTFVLKKLGYKVEYSGNIGTPLSELILKNRNLDFTVTEVSSFQLECCNEFSPIAATILNITPDHQGRYDSFLDYAKTKFKIFANIANTTKCIINSDLLFDWENFSSSQNPVVFSSSEETTKFNYVNDTINIFHRIPFLNLQETTMRGKHNAENIMATIALIDSVTDKLRHTPEAVKDAICEFRIAPHRIEFVKKINDIQFINDSKATNPDAVLVALRTIGGDENVCLILGGVDKGMPFSQILIEKDKIKEVFIIGKSQQIIFDALKQDLKCHLCGDFKSAIIAAYDTAKAGDTVLLSPSCASFDMFKSYKDRGDQFKNIVKEIKS